MARLTRWPQTLCCLGVLVLLVAQPQLSELSEKKLIEVGWDEPDTAFLRRHILEMQRTPFDGCVFHADYKKSDGVKGSFTWQSWGSQGFTETDLKDAFADLRAVEVGRFKSNFLRFNTTPGNIDWFDDHRAVMTNATLAARLARGANFPGIQFDIEQYEGQLFDYHKQRDSTTKSWAVYASQARLRGRELMQAFQEGYPGLTVLLTFGYSLPWTQSHAGTSPLADCSYGLLAALLDGMVEAASGRTRIVDGYEYSYGYRTAEQFAAARKTMKVDLLQMVRDPNKYRRVFSAAFGVWMDHDWRTHGWNIVDFSRNYFTPTTFESSAGEALRATDEYVWVYSETPRWWSPDGKPVKLPDDYESALRRARDTAVYRRPR